jgi:hypothetical protein
MLLINCGLLILRNGLPNNEKHNASKIVLLPSPFLPMISVVDVLFNKTLLAELPVDRKFFHEIDLNVIISERD